MVQQSLLGNNRTLLKPIQFIQSWNIYDEGDEGLIEPFTKESWSCWTGLADKPVVYAKAKIRANSDTKPLSGYVAMGKEELMDALLCWTGLRHLYIIYTDSVFYIANELNEEIMKVDIFDDGLWSEVKDSLLLNML